MAWLTTKSVLDAVQSRIVDQSDNLRAKMLVWLNIAMQQVLNEPRDWEFLKKSASVTVTNSVITLPADFGDFLSLECGDYFYTTESQLTPDEVIMEYEGFVIDELLGTLTIYPATIEVTATLKYKAAFPVTDYTDGTGATLFPAEFRPLFTRYVMTVRDEFDAEAEASMSFKLDQLELKKMKALDNKRKAVPKINSHGYRRTA